MRTRYYRQFRSPGTKRPLCSRFVPGNESAWERNVPVPFERSLAASVNSVRVVV